MRFLLLIVPLPPLLDQTSVFAVLIHTKKLREGRANLTEAIFPRGKEAFLAAAFETRRKAQHETLTTKSLLCAIDRPLRGSFTADMRRR